MWEEKRTKESIWEGKKKKGKHVGRDKDKKERMCKEKRKKESTWEGKKESTLEGKKGKHVGRKKEKKESPIAQM